MTRLHIDNVSAIFAKNPRQALALADQNYSRAEIQHQTNAVLGVHNAQFTVNPGETLVLMGLSGSGKSTLLRTINYLIRPTRGRVCIETQSDIYDLSRVNAAQLRHIRTNLISMVFQQFALLPWRSVRDNIGFGLEIKGMNKQQRDKIIDQQLELVGLTDWDKHMVAELSGGMQQRVGLARAFATGAPILLMDEPFSALDPLIRNRLQNDLIDLQKQLHKTIIFVSHDLDEALKLGDHIAIMDDGRLAQYGTPQDIIFSPATDHIREFIKDINPLRFLKARDIMVALHIEDSGLVSATATPDTPIHSLISALAKRNGDIGIIENGHIIGKVRAIDIIKRIASLY